MARIRAWREMDEVTGLDRFEPAPDPAWHDIRIVRPKQDLRLDAHRPLVTVVTSFRREQRSTSYPHRM